MSTDRIQAGYQPILPSIDISRNSIQNRLFSDLDVNKDGFLSTDEVRNTNQFHDTTDIDQDGIITLREVLSYIRGQSESQSPQLINALPQSIADYLASVLKETKPPAKEPTTSPQTTSHDVSLDQENVSNLVDNLSHDNDLSVVA